MNARGVMLNQVWGGAPSDLVPGVKLRGITAAFGPGVHLIVGDVADGMAGLHALVTGAVAPKRGTVRIAEQDPHREPGIRRRIGALDLAGSMPPWKTVGECVAHVAACRGPADKASSIVSAAMLEPDRRVSGLHDAERRALGFQLAMALDAPAMVLLHDPFRFGVASVESDQTGGSPVARLRRVAEQGAAVLITAPRTELYFDMADTVYVLSRGQLAGGQALRSRMGLVEVLVRFAGSSTEPGRAFVRSLSEHAVFRRVAWRERESDVRLSMDASEFDAGLALAQKLVVQHRLAVVSMTPVAPSRHTLEAVLRQGTGTGGAHA